MRYSKLMLAAAVFGALGTQMAGATPTAEEAAQLGKTLTPLGAIKAGNKEGTIPQWTGGVCKPPAGYQPKMGLEAGGSPYIDPFADDKPLFKITAENMAQYADKLDDGFKELFRRFPKTFYMNIYPTRRSACNADWVYENTIKRVMNPKIVGGNVPSLTGAQAQFPFPIPKQGVEVMWNTLLFYKNVYTAGFYKTLYVDSAGNRSLIDGDKSNNRSKYWDNSIAMLPEGSRHMEVFSFKQYPPAGQGTMFMQHRQLRPDLNGDPSWSYTPGMRRVRLSPESTYDGVAPTAGGTFLFDEGSGFAGRMDRFDFKLMGRIEMYVPYNNSEQKLNFNEAVAKPNHLDPEAVRYELHRVWNVVATLKPGERHVQQKKVFYIDEDSWQMMSYQGFDHAGKVHHFYTFHVSQLYDRPGIAYHSFNAYDMSKGAYTHWMFSGPAPAGSQVSYGVHKIKLIPDSTYTPDGLQSAGVR